MLNNLRNKNIAIVEEYEGYKEVRNKANEVLENLKKSY